MSDIEPQHNLFGFLCNARLVKRGTARRVVAALVDDVFSRRVHLGRVLGHLDHLFVGPPTHSFDPRSHHVLMYSLEDRC